MTPPDARSAATVARTCRPWARLRFGVEDVPCSSARSLRLPAAARHVSVGLRIELVAKKYIPGASLSLAAIALDDLEEEADILYTGGAAQPPSSSRKRRRDDDDGGGRGARARAS